MGKLIISEIQHFKAYHERKGCLVLLAPPSTDEPEGVHSPKSHFKPYFKTN